MIQRNTPELFVRDVDEAVGFYTEVLGFQPAGRMPEDAAKPAEWAMVQRGAAAFMFERPPEARSADGVAFYLAVEDAAQTAQELRSRGAQVEAPLERFYGMREATVLDPNGYKLVFTSPVQVTEPAQT